MERNFDIITDSCCGMPQEFTEANEIAVLPLGYTVDGKTYGGAENETLPLKELYARLRAGSDCHTFQVTAEQARPQIEKSFQKGRDVRGSMRLRRKAQTPYPAPFHGGRSGIFKKRRPNFGRGGGRGEAAQNKAPAARDA